MYVSVTQWIVAAKDAGGVGHGASGTSDDGDGNQTVAGTSKPNTFRIYVSHQDKKRSRWQLYDSRNRG